MLDPLPDWFRFIIVPILIGIISSMVGFFLNSLSAESDRVRTIRDMQTTKAIEICVKVIATLDAVNSKLKYSAWHVAWRKALPPTADYVGSDLYKADEQRWEDYNVALTTLRDHQIEHETDLKGYFGDTGFEPNLFLEIDAMLNEIANILSIIYHSHDSGDSTIWLGHGKAYLEIPKDGFTKEDRLKSRDEFVRLFAFTECRIKILAETMIKCIQVQNVGTIGGPGPFPDRVSPQQMKELKETDIRKNPGLLELP
jgi:hypothetical protein